MESCLRFPPFPSLTVADPPLLTFSDWRTRGFWVWNGLPSETPRPTRDSRHETLIDLEIGHDPSNQSKDLERIQARTQRLADRKRQASGMPMRLSRADCLKVGQAGARWREPEETFQSSNDVSEAPFNRLLSATRDFLYSRHEELQFIRCKRLFDVMRNALGLRSDFAGAHWPGMSGQAYDGPSRSDLIVADSAYEGSVIDPHEVCVLLRKTVNSVRGLLALARKEAEASWEIEPALKLAEITSAYLAYLVVHRVFPESPYREDFTAASDLALSAPSRLMQAKALEDELVSPQGINKVLWAATSAAGGKQTPENQDIERETGAESEDGGWSASHSMNQVLQHPATLIHDCGPVLHDIRYERRKIVKVEAVADLSSDFANCHRLTTIPAPWTEEERWRLHRPQVDVGKDEYIHDSVGTSNPEVVVETPAILPIIARLQHHHLEDPQVLVGCGLRGAYRQLRYGDQEIWIIKVKDYVLPSFWQSAQIVQPSIGPQLSNK